MPKFKVLALNDELANGRPRDLGRTYGGLRLLPALGADGWGEAG